MNLLKPSNCQIQRQAPFLPHYTVIPPNHPVSPHIQLSTSPQHQGNKFINLGNHINGLCRPQSPVKYQQLYPQQQQLPPQQQQQLLPPPPPQQQQYPPLHQPQNNHNESESENSDEEKKKKIHKKNYKKKKHNKKKVSSSSSEEEEEENKRRKKERKAEKEKAEEEVVIDVKEKIVEKAKNEAEKSKIIQFYIFEENVNGKNVYEYQHNMNIEECIEYGNYLFPHLNQSSPLFNEEIRKEFIENEVVRENYKVLIDSLINTCSKSENLSKSECLNLLKIEIQSMKDTFNESKTLQRLEKLLENCQKIQSIKNQDINKPSEVAINNKPIESEIIKFYCGESEYKTHSLDFYLNLDGNRSQSFFRVDDLYFFFPQLNQKHLPKFDEEERKKFIENEMIKIYYYDLMRVVLIKYGYVVTFEDSTYDHHPNNLKKWRYKEETKKVLNHLRHSIETTFCDDQQINLINKILQDQSRYNSSDDKKESDIIKFYRGEMKCKNTCWFKDYFDMKDEDLKKWNPLSELDWLLPIVGQDSPSFTENDQKIFQSDDLLKNNFKEMICILLQKYGFKVAEDGRNFDTNDNYEYWREKNEPFVVFYRITTSIKDICGSGDKYNRLIVKIINYKNSNSVSVKDFICYNKKVNGYSFEDIINMNENDFNNFNIDEYLPWILPTKKQNYPKLCSYDINEIKELSITASRRYNEFLKKILSKYGLTYNIDKRSKVILSDKSKYRGNEDDFKELMNRMKEYFSNIDKIVLIKKITDILRFINNNEEEE